MTNSRWQWFAILVTVGLIAVVAGERYASHLEQDNNFCASCHTQPETEYLARFVRAVAKQDAEDLAAFHHRKDQVKCIDCHSGEGIVGRSVVFSLAVWDAFKHYSGIARQPAVMIVPLQNEACSKCHLDAIIKPGFENHMHNVMPDPAAPFMRCTDCHLSHRLGDERNAFQFRRIIFPQCEFCHIEMGKGPRGLVR